MKFIQNIHKVVLFTSVLLIFSCSSPQARRPITSSSKTIMKESVELSKKNNEIEEAYLKEIIKNDSLTKYFNSQKGFWFAYNKKDTLNNYQIKKGDKLLYTYSVKDIQKSIIYSQQEVGEKTYYVDEEVIIQGLQEGIKMMKEKEIITFLFPSYKAYGYSGDQNRITSGQPLVYKVELLKIN